MTYGGFDKARLNQDPVLVGPGPLRYSIEGTALFNGQKAIGRVFDQRSGFSEAEQVPPAPAAAPDQGLYVKTEVEYLAPSIGSGVSMYVSYATLFLVPAWSTSDGAWLHFDVYRDGVHRQRYDYRVHRKSFVWLPMVLVAWVNFFTPTERDAFEAVTKQFLADAHAQLAG